MAAAAPVSAYAEAIPYFARKYGVTCSQCHVSPPKLNAFGERFLSNGYRMPGFPTQRTFPFAVWVSGRADMQHSDELDRVTSYLNRIEIISGGPVVAPWLSYFVEWRPLSMELRADGSLRDRSGRFEDLFLVAARDRFEVMAGQFRQVQQVDVSRRVGVSEPLVLSASLPGFGGGSSREQSLRAFAPAARSPAVRASWREPLAGRWRWTGALAVPFPGELSIPLSQEARIEASNEMEWSPKGVFAESWIQRDLTTFGAHAFYDDSDRYLFNAIASGHRAIVHWTLMAGAARTDAGMHGRWSLEAEVFPRSWFGAGGRLENRAGDGLPSALLPYLNLHFPGTRYTIRLTLEHRIQRGRDATFLEVGTVF